MKYYIGMLDSNSSKNSECFIVKTPYLNYIIDTGYKKAHNDLLKLYNKVPSMKSRLSEKLDILVISHGDQDHCGGFQELMKKMKPDAVVFSPLHLIRYHFVNEIASAAMQHSWKRRVKEEQTSIGNFLEQNSSDYVFYRFKSRVEEKIDYNDDEAFIIDGFEVTDFEHHLLRGQIMVMIRKGVSVSTTLQVLSSEFETYDTGQTEKIEESIIHLIKELRTTRKIGYQILDMLLEHSFIDMKELSKLYVNPLDLEEFVRLIRYKVLRKIDNAMSLVVRIRRSLFTGDAEKRQIEKFTRDLKHGPNYFATVKVPHHGSKNNHVKEMYNEIKPAVALLKTSSLVHRNYDTSKDIVALDILDCNTRIYSSRHNIWAETEFCIGFLVEIQEPSIDYSNDNNSIFITNVGNEWQVVDSFQIENGDARLFDPEICDDLEEDCQDNEICEGFRELCLKFHRELEMKQRIGVVYIETVN